jgi:phosphatidylserine decarboxylase
MPDSLFIFFQKTLPKRWLTELAGSLARREGGVLMHRVIAWFVARYGVNMSEAANPDITSYNTFNAFFTRSLKTGVRPLAAATWVSPVDGVVSQAGMIKAGQIFQAKGHDYSATALLGGDASLGAQFAQGQFATIYLSPKDYHRIHMPCDGTLKQIIYIPGDLYSVNPTTVAAIPGLFARNERVVLVFEGSNQAPNNSHTFAMVLVGATIVGSIATKWTGVVNSTRPTARTAVNLTAQAENNPFAAKGADIAQFLLGSTVILLAGVDAGVNFSSLAPKESLRCAAALPSGKPR